MKIFLNTRARLPWTWAPHGGTLLVIARTRAEAAVMLIGRRVPDDVADRLARDLRVFRASLYGPAVKALFDFGVSPDEPAVYAWYESTDDEDADLVIRVDLFGQCTLLGKLRPAPGGRGLHLEPTAPTESETAK